MDEKFKFEKLIIWQKAMDFGEEIFILTKSFPKDEMYNLSSQIRRAVDSIALNISEGATGQSNDEFKRFMSYSIRSLAEVDKAKRRNYLNSEQFQKNYEASFNLMNMMTAFKKSIK